MKRKQINKTLNDLYPPSAPCCCAICRAYCARPGWWTVAEATRAIEAGYGGRMMLEFSPDRSFAVLAPALKGCEGYLALQECAGNGCTFLTRDRCELHGTGHEPLECLFCHHLRKGMGTVCHAALEKDWHTQAGQRLVAGWIERTLREHAVIAASENKASERERELGPGAGSQAIEPHRRTSLSGETADDPWHTESAETMRAQP